jgi:1,4-dihydroxy-2-naphthoate octaprenyltransferase
MASCMNGACYVGSGSSSFRMWTRPSTSLRRRAPGIPAQRPGTLGGPGRVVPGDATRTRESIVQPRIREGLWRLADPKISITSAAAMMIGAPLAARDGDIRIGWLVVTALALFCMEVAKNAWGDVIDYDSGTDLAVAPEDRTSFSGGKRVMVDELLTRRETWAIAFAFGGAGVLLGAGVVLLQAPSAIWVGAVGVVLGWSYHGPPLQLAYRGLGELDVVLCYGPLISLSTYVIQTDRYAWDVVWLSLPLGLLIMAFLWVNEFPDHDADAAHGKDNLIVALGKHRASRVLPWIYAAAFALLGVLPLATGLTGWIRLGWIAVPTAGLACMWTWRDPLAFHRHRPVQPMALLTFVLYSVGAGGGVLLHR